MAAKKTTIYVTGDTIIDQHIYVKEKETSTGYPKTDLVSRKGGSEMLHELLLKFIPFEINEHIRKLQEKNNKPEIDEKEKEGNTKKIVALQGFENLNINFCLKKSAKENYSPKNRLSFLYWKPYTGNGNKQNPKWRIDSKMGFGNSFDSSKNNVGFELKKIQPNEYDFLVIDDAGLEYRTTKKMWKPLLEKDKYKHFILKMSAPVGKGPIFNELIGNKEFAGKLTIITSAQELRKSNVKISKGISWEQSMTDLVMELEKNPELKLLKRCHTLIVTFSTEGAYYLTGETGNKKSRMIFDNQLLEKEYLTEHKKGEVVGYQNTFTACYVAGLILEEIGKSNLELRIESGLSATRKLAEVGHIKSSDHPDFPYEAIMNEMINPSYRFASAFVPQPEIVAPESFGNWSILKGNYKAEKQTAPLFNEAVLHVLDKKKGLINAPQYSVNHFFTVDRKEIEGLRNIKQMVLAYDKDKGENKPLSIAVFGSPGSGKSFVVKQLEKGIYINNTSFLEFNLSQFSNPGDLIGAMHQVRDEVLKGKLPFVFWDEFDSKEYMWLQYLLAPMQDGQFQEGQITHNIGRCIFIFAGGTSYDFEQFGYIEPDKPEPPKDNDYSSYGYQLAEYKEKYSKFENFKLKKGPDFKSRLNGYLNVMGPNKEFKYNKETGKWDSPNEQDVFYPIRRAILFNALSGFDASKNKPDYNLLNAILRTSRYTHGARSFEKVIKSIFQDSKGRMSRSNLPPDTLLDAHLSKKEFIKFLDSSVEFEMIANKIAPFIHQNWMTLGDKDGWKLEYHKEFEYLPGHLKRENVAAALRIPTILKEAGYMIKDNPDLDDSEAFTKEISKNPELCKRLAILEHNGWWQYKEKNGWKKGKRNDDKKSHDCLVDFMKLPEKEQIKDKDAVKNIPGVLRNADLYVTKL